MSEWKPIETAQKDETDILLVAPNGEMIVAAYCSEPEPAWHTLDGPVYHPLAFTHWMPLPPPPPPVERGQP